MRFRGPAATLPCSNRRGNPRCQYPRAVILILMIAVTLDVQGPAYGRQATGRIRVPVEETFRELLRDEDTDGDKKITVNDLRIAESERGDKRFVLPGVDGSRHLVAGTYFLSNLLQELSLLVEAGAETAIVRLDRRLNTCND